MREHKLRRNLLIDCRVCFASCDTRSGRSSEFGIGPNVCLDDISLDKKDRKFHGSNKGFTSNMVMETKFLDFST